MMAQTRPCRKDCDIRTAPWRVTACWRCLSPWPCSPDALTVPSPKRLEESRQHALSPRSLQPKTALVRSRQAKPSARRELGPRRLLPLQSPDTAKSDSRSSRLPQGPAAKTVSSLAIVIGVFLLLVTVLRYPAKRRPGALPPEAAEVLGIVPLTGKQQLHLVRLGSKLLLLNLSGGRVEKVAELAEPQEVRQIVATCQPGRASVVSETVREMLTKLDGSRTATDVAQRPTGFWEATHG